MPFIDNIITKKITQNWVIIVIAIISGVFSGPAVNAVSEYFKISQTNDVITRKELVVELKEERKYYKELYDDCNENYISSRKKLQDIKSSLIIIKAIQNDIPIIFWLKDRESRVVFVNEAYSDYLLTPFNVSSNDLIYKKGYEIYGQKATDKFIENDILAMANATPLLSIDDITYPDGSVKTLVSIKFRRVVGSTVVGSGGFALESHLFEDLF